MLFEPFGGLPQPLTDKTLLATPGETLLHYAENLPANVALVDTPDFDTAPGAATRIGTWPKPPCGPPMC